MLYFKQTPWLDIRIDEELKKVIIEQRWNVSWKNLPGTEKWTEKEKKHFTKKIQRIVNHSWGNAFKLKVTGLSSFARAHKRDKIQVDFNISHSVVNSHWSVKAIKILPGFYHRSYTYWVDRKIELYQTDVKLELKPAGFRQRVVAHEIGHTIGILYDDYDEDSKYYEDKRSIMSNGMAVRRRHFDFILTELNNMIPETVFVL